MPPGDIQGFEPGCEVSNGYLNRIIRKRDLKERKRDVGGDTAVPRSSPYGASRDITGSASARPTNIKGFDDSRFKTLFTNRKRHYLTLTSKQVNYLFFELKKPKG
jgi:hypothetical protein